LTLVVLLVGMIANVAADTDACPASAEYNFLCGPGNAEDLVLVPDTKWIIASGMAPGASIYLIDSQQKTWSALYPADAPRARQDMAVFGACPGSPDPNHFVSHGLNLRPGAGGHSTLYVVGHGGREAIEVFDVDATGSSPALTWTGCVEMPEGMVANSVASFSDGSLVATVPLHPDKEIADAIAGEVTGAVYHWSPGDAGFTIIPGTELPYANGIEVSSDGREIYVASSGLLTVTAFSNSRPARALRVTEPMAIVPDNLHMAADGSLVTAGLVADDPRCGNVQGPAKFDLKEFASCPRPFMALAIDPQSMDGTVLAAGSAHEQFSNITMALQVGGELWLGSFAGDRIAYRSLEESD
jgi:sugar lactone lactonase YvrE